MPFDRVQRAFPHLRTAAQAFFRREPTTARRPVWRRLELGAFAALAVVALILATTKLNIRGSWHGLYLLSGPGWRPFELKDDLKLGDGRRLIGGFSLARLRGLFRPELEGFPRLELDWDEAEGGGVINNHLSKTTVLQTVLGRYVDDDGNTPQGIFVGGAIADVAADFVQDQSGMAVRDARGWHHVWCNVNEIVVIRGMEHRPLFPGGWRFRGSRVLADSADRVVLASDSEFRSGDVHLRMERFAYFRAGRPSVRLGINLTNLSSAPVTISFGYGDEPWVGEFGSAAGNIGWAPDGMHRVVSQLDPRSSPGAGIADLDSGIANFIVWRRPVPDVVYFGNHAGTPSLQEYGQPLASNEVFIGLEWLDRPIPPDGTFSIELALGLAVPGPDGRPAFPSVALEP